MNLTASITIRKGETKGTYETDYNGSPLVLFVIGNIIINRTVWTFN